VVNVNVFIGVIYRQSNMEGFNPVAIITRKLFYIEITTGVVISLIAIFSITSCSIGMHCMSAHKSGYNFMVFSLIMSLILLILGIAIIVWCYI
jgi:hypothetical protein